MPFIPHTEKEIQEMLATVGVEEINALFSEIPLGLQSSNLQGIPSGVSEAELMREMQFRASKDLIPLCFLGAGAYQHHIPAAVWEIATRGEFYTAYTPYQPEASQGSLQLIYEYQTMMSSLMALEVSNASLYDGASALAEAILMTVRISNKKGISKVLMPESVHPNYRAAVNTIISQQSIELITVPVDKNSGCVNLTVLDEYFDEHCVALVTAQPNFFGVIDDVDQLTEWAKGKKLLSIAVVNPMAMAYLKPPGDWGAEGVDIACGEGQPLGIPLAGGGPYYGFLCCKKKHVRQMPGRIVGKTHDLNQKPGFVLTLQAREQHIRRAKATSNICTNQGLMVTASTIYMSLMGPEGLRLTALQSHLQTRKCMELFQQIPGVKLVFSAANFHEFVVQLPIDADVVLAALATKGIQAGYNLTHDYPYLKNCILICVTETKSQHDIEIFAATLQSVLQGVFV